MNKSDTPSSQGMFSNLIPTIFRAEDKKPPKGFEKFFRKREERQTTKSDKSKIWKFVNQF